MKRSAFPAVLLAALMGASTLGPNDRPPAPANCLSLADTVSCHTFNQMLAAKDKDLADLGQYEFRDDYVCFEKDDRFFTVFVDHWRSGDGLRLYSGTFSEYRSGVSYDFKTVPLIQHRDDDPMSTNPLGEKKDPFPTKGMEFVADPSEISLSFGFENLNNEKTQRQISIRISTLRFVDIFDSPTVGRHEVTGHCVAYKPVQGQSSAKKRSTR